MYESVCVKYLFSQQWLQDRQVSCVPQGENYDFACVVEPRSSSYIELRATGCDEWAHRVTWNKQKTKTELTCVNHTLSNFLFVKWIALFLTKLKDLYDSYLGSLSV